MVRLTIRVSILTLCCVTAVVAVPVFASGEAQAAKRHAHVKKHPRHWRHASQPWFGEPRRYATPYVQPGPVCPGIGRSFDCKIWPPPFEDDPDRKVSKH
jgi:hypothetical protein